MQRAATIDFQSREPAEWTPDPRASRRANKASSRLISQQARQINGALTKRALDVTIAATIILLALPMFIVVALLIKIDSPGPIFFRQKRYGIGRQPFEILKFRSMTVQESTGGFRQAAANDDRVTRIGRFMRRSSIDEAPQLINVLLGDMSLVGPRPHAMAMDDTYEDVVTNYPDRFLVRPGLTGLAQITGYRGPTDTLEKISRRVARDRVYIRRWSPLLDVAILARTPASLVRDPNAL
ncbi:sugar transferase [Methylorubrum extorquens]|jgi:putative colanic acid biosynthesis UDP-glucose lipid carrier transferase|uniref:sugar transferase n=1 Tax=Methylorubrum extorquens TaxID=408 RepID=UPI002237E8EB|nr:sugar transferase [Methylorubrum extorquens]UYW26639.1 sugar transferase [Methylorubrum extorquens]